MSPPLSSSIVVWLVCVTNDNVLSTFLYMSCTNRITFTPTM